MNDQVELIIKAALAEDLGDEGDLTSKYFVPEEALGRGRIFVKEPGVVTSGLEVAKRVFAEVDPDLEVEIAIPDGTSLKSGDTALRVEGSLRSILTGERTALNFIQQLSGIATLTKKFVNLTEGTKAEILDTRKTTPGWRLLEKRAVAHGGGTNHRMGLYDAVMVKDNHLLAKNDRIWLQKSIVLYKKDFPDRKMQLEVDRLDQLADFLNFEEVDSILLDNMELATLIEAVKMRDEAKSAVTLEASGGVNLETVVGIAQTGVDFISVGALTHSARAVDFSLELETTE